ncbi:MAG: hypothetical protein E6Q59_10880 [Nitrosomonas sp.]|nr:hypothetical protein [Nitrosomonas sp.]OQW82705.1 MAG: hypothetical protein BVN30_08185 [Proteobacteria bacterium ST_bin16]TXI35497.1 MAG: hypothetical protein E6Q59_10880 [Nitrosomonas sp.]
MSKLKIDLDDLREQAMNDDPDEIAGNDLEAAAELVFVALQKEGDERIATYSDKIEAMQNHPELVAAHTLAHAINRLELTHRTVKIEELRLLGSIADSLERIASTAESAKGKRNE